jgi:hypothetical protein
MERMWKETFEAQFAVLFRNLHGRADINYETAKSGPDPYRGQASTAIWIRPLAWKVGPIIILFNSEKCNK